MSAQSSEEQNMSNKVYIVLRNGNIERVFSSVEEANRYVKVTGGWNTWHVVEKEVESQLTLF
jgi:dsDNA-binding SOS-regulon protein